jgi:hypothetical protein
MSRLERSSNPDDAERMPQLFQEGRRAMIGQAIGFGVGATSGAAALWFLLSDDPPSKSSVDTKRAREAAPGLSLSDGIRVQASVSSRDLMARVHGEF